MAEDKIQSPEEQLDIGDDTSTGEKKLNYQYPFFLKFPGKRLKAIFFTSLRNLKT